MRKQLTFEDFVNRARKIHGSTYEYLLDTFDTISKKVDIVCEQHGIFSQLAYDHARGRGCPQCARNQKMTFEQFKKRAIEVHGKKYKYSKKTFNLKGKNRAVIQCKKHGLFEQNIYAHTTGGKGCQKCFYESTRNTTEKFITRALEAHDGRFSYTRTNYLTSRTKIEIRCPEHGYFWAMPATHLSSPNGGCPRCTNIVLKEFTLLYLVTVTKKDEPDKKYLKVGITQNTIRRRFSKDIRYKYRKLDSFYMRTEAVREIERKILSECSRYKVDVPEEERTAGYTEWLEFSEYKKRQVRKVFKKYKEECAIEMDGK